MTNVAKPKGRARIKIKLGSPFLDLTLAAQAEATGYSEGHLREIHRGKQIGEAFIAAVMQTFPNNRFETLFELVPAIGSALSTVSTPVPSVPEPITAPMSIPHSYEDAIERFGLKPEQGPPLFAGADTFEPDRIVWRVGDVAVLAFEPGFIRTYAVTREHDESLQLLASLGHPTWTGNRIKL